MKTTRIYTIVIGTILAFDVFWQILPTLAGSNSQPAKARSEVVNLTGTVRKLAVEGTCYQLNTDDGKKYELMGKFPKIEGTRVQVRGVIATDTATICQVGQPVRVKSVRVIK
jgi:hypothetical protein